MVLSAAPPALVGCFGQRQKEEGRSVRRKSFPQLYVKPVCVNIPLTQAALF